MNFIRLFVSSKISQTYTNFFVGKLEEDDSSTMFSIAEK